MKMKIVTEAGEFGLGDIPFKEISNVAWGLKNELRIVDEDGEELECTSHQVRVEKDEAIVEFWCELPNEDE
mgnify:CR=1